MWNARTGRIVRRYPLGGRPAISPDGRTLVLGRQQPLPGKPSASVEVLDVRNGRHRELAHDLHQEWIMSLAFMPDGKRIVGAAFDGTFVWEVASGTNVERFRDEQTEAAGGASWSIPAGWRS